jgi:hypothetical protein
MPNFGYHFARQAGHAMRIAYNAALPLIARRPIEPRSTLPFEVYAYSGESALPEQVASIRSFLRHAGRPNKWTVVSDGTYSARSIELLQRLDPCISVSTPTQRCGADLPDKLRDYLTNHPTGKQLALITSLPIDGPTLYVDSDVLFFAGASALASLPYDGNYYLADCRLSADKRLLRNSNERENPVNTGVLFLTSQVDWSLSFERFLQLSDAPIFFTNQTMTHLTMHATGARPLDPKTFVLQLDDQFIYPDRYASPNIVLRHYVNPVRHKFWAALWRP